MGPGGPVAGRDTLRVRNFTEELKFKESPAPREKAGLLRKTGLVLYRPLTSEHRHPPAPSLSLLKRWLR
jgi:hypothetical protein